MLGKLEASDENLLQAYIENLEAADIVSAAVAFRELEDRDLSQRDASLLRNINRAFDVHIDTESSSKYSYQDKFVSESKTFTVKKRGDGYYPLSDTVIWARQGKVIDGKEPSEEVLGWTKREINQIYAKGEQKVVDRLRELESGIGVDPTVLKKYEVVPVRPDAMHSFDEIGVRTSIVIDAFEEALENKNAFRAFHIWMDLEFGRDKGCISAEDAERFEALKEKYGVEGSVSSESDFDIPWPRKDERDAPKRRECIRHTFTFKAPYPEDQPNLAVLSQVYLDDPAPYGSPPGMVLGADGKPVLDDEWTDKWFSSSIAQELLQKQREMEKSAFEAHLNPNIKPIAWLDVYEDALEAKDPRSAYYLWNRLKDMDDRFTPEEASRLDALHQEYGVKAEAYGDAEYQMRHCERYYLGATFEGPYPGDEPNLSMIQWHSNTLVGDPFPSDPDLYGADRKRIWPQYFDQRVFQKGVYERVIDRQNELNAKLIESTIEQSGLGLNLDGLDPDGVSIDGLPDY